MLTVDVSDAGALLEYYEFPFRCEDSAFDDRDLASGKWWRRVFVERIANLPSGADSLARDVQARLGTHLPARIST
jgi:hypothetical protein